MARFAAALGGPAMSAGLSGKNPSSTKITKDAKKILVARQQLPFEQPPTAWHCIEIFRAFRVFRGRLIF
jgi:hypothetical protein